MTPQSLLKISNEVSRRVNELLRAGQKIEAIRTVRDSARIPRVAGQLISASNIGLRDAKDAVEHRQWELNIILVDGSRAGVENAGGARFMRCNPVKRFVLDMGDGEVEVDMDGMSMTFLQGLATMQLDDVCKLMDLYKRIKDWEGEQ